MKGDARRWEGIGQLQDYGERSGIDDFARRMPVPKKSFSNPTLSAEL
jgi:hypothetical protein